MLGRMKGGRLFLCKFFVMKILSGYLVTGRKSNYLEAPKFPWMGHNSQYVAKLDF